MAIRTTLKCHTSAAFLLISTFLITSASAAITSQFQNFYPQTRPEYEYILHHNCSQQFANYLTGRPQDFTGDWLGGGGTFTVLVQPVVNCLLENTSEYIKAAASSAQVLLGVTPPILATLGASSDELAMLSVIGRRPLLSLLISFGSPGVYMERVFDFRQPEKMLRRSPGRYRPRRPDTTFKRRMLAATQYIIALGAVAKVVALSWRLGVGTVCAWWSETIFAPLVWTVLSIPIHFAGTFAIRLRVRRIYSDEDKETDTGFGQWLRMLPARLHGYWKSEWVPAVSQDEIKIISYEEGILYVIWSWVLSAATVVHILFGSLVLSGLLFIGPGDALMVIIRYVLSVLSCRILVAFELSGIRHRYIPESDEISSIEVVEIEDKTVRYWRSTHEVL
ncbi:hypothetical protein F5Y07DRAFT_215382 [Xylaria sp. FL0933]|nr:hypothetical protein F5Y07DRAFT_215382 [Xylaria sp. FL0933]